MPQCNDDHWEKYHTYSGQVMKRLYVRVANTIDGKQKRTYVAVGWICPVCRKTQFDEETPKLKGSYSKFKTSAYGVDYT